MSAGAPTPQRSPIFYDILGYLTDHPDAQDTVEGIVEWWLLKQSIKRTKTQVNAALAQLVAEELVIAHAGVNKRPFYCVNRSQLRHIRRILKEQESANER